MSFYEKSSRTYIIEGPYPEGSTLFGSSVAGKFQLIEYEGDEIMGGAVFKTKDEAREERRRSGREHGVTA